MTTTTTRAGSGGVQSVERVFELLEVITAAGDPGSTPSEDPSADPSEDTAPPSEAQAEDAAANGLCA